MNDEDQNTRLKKQKYLNSEIIQKGYDPLKFKDFLESRKPGGGEDIDIWNYFELVTLVKDFQFDEKSYLKEEKPYNGDPKSEKLEKLENEIIEEEYQKYATGREIGKTSFTGRTDIELIISKYDVRPGGIFTSSYVNFEIITKPFEWQVARKFADFFWLRKNLAKMFPGIMVPSLPNKKTLKNFSERNLIKNKYLLEKFLNDCIRNPLLKNCRVLADFLFISDESTYQIKKKDFNNCFRPERLEHHITVDGKQTLTINQPLKVYFDEAHIFLYEGDKIYKKIKKLNKKLMMDMDQLSTTLFDLGGAFSSLYNLSNEFNSHISINKNSLLENIYVTLNNMMVDLGNSAVNQMKIVYDHMCLFFKYEDKYNYSLKEIFEERNSLYREYNKTRGKKTDTDVKEKVFSLFQKDSDVSSIKDKFAFYNQQVSEELSRCFDDKSKRYLSHFSNLSKIQTDVIYDAHIIWADVLTHFGEVTGENPPKKMSFDLKDTNKKQFFYDKSGDGEV